MITAPIKITIEGDYWDCQIYRGRLYLWTFDGEVFVYNWDNIIDSLIESKDEQLALICAFCRGDFLYKQDLKLFFQNETIMGELRRQFGILSRREIVFSKQQIERFCRGKQKLPTPELPVDTGMYNNKIYSADETGLYQITAHRKQGKYPISTRSNKLWDCPLLSLRIGNRGNIAISAGDEGLYEYLMVDDFISTVDKNIELISKNHSSFSNWAFSSIYSSSYISSSYLAPYIHEKSDIDYQYSEEHKSLFVSKDIIDESRIFGDQKGFSWGSNEKFYKYTDGKLAIVNFVQSGVKNGDNEAFGNRRIISLDEWKGDVISCGVGYFGTIIECENAIVVLLSDGSIVTLPVRAVRWRVYPRTLRYENHLHIIKDDAIDIYSFNNDYFVNQKSKDYGIEYREKTIKMPYPNA